MISFGVRSIVIFHQSEEKEPALEERVFVVSSDSHQNAIEVAEISIREYCGQFGHEFTPYFELYEMDEVCTCGEVFSIVHEWPGSVGEFIQQRLPHLKDNQ